MKLSTNLYYFVLHRLKRPSKRYLTISSTGCTFYDSSKKVVSGKTSAPKILDNIIRSKMVTKNLAIFDFDYTVVSKNTDTEVLELLTTDIPEEIEEIRETNCWTIFMGEAFKLLYKDKIDKTSIHKTIIEIPETKGMCKLFRALHNDFNYDIIIISDSNSIFIQDWLEAHALTGCVKEVFTNPAHYDDNGLLLIEPYQYQFECKLCSRNLCKGAVMKKYIESAEKLGTEYVRVIYAGDGSNDFCPMIKLRAADVAFPRLGFKIMNRIEKHKDDPELTVKAVLKPWTDGCDILKTVRELEVINSSGNIKNLDLK